MAKKLVMGLFVLGVFALLVATMVPGLQSAPTTNATQSTELEEAQGLDVTERLQLNATNISDKKNEASIRIRDTETFDTTTVDLNGSETRTVQVEGENVSVTLVKVVTPDTAQVQVSYPSMYGWAEGPRAFMSESGLMVIILGSMMLMGLLVVGVRA